MLKVKPTQCRRQHHDVGAFFSFNRAVNLQVVLFQVRNINLLDHLLVLQIYISLKTFGQGRFTEMDVGTGR